MKLLWISLLLAGTGCRTFDLVEVPTEELNFGYVRSVESLPLRHSLQEIESRSWTGEKGNRVSFLRSRRFAGLPDRPDVYVAFFGSPKTLEVVCIDFYSFYAENPDGHYQLLCHESNCPSIDPTVTAETQNDRVFFRIQGEDPVPGKNQTLWIGYAYELNPKSQMLEGFSRIVAGADEDLR